MSKTYSNYKFYREYALIQAKKSGEKNAREIFSFKRCYPTVHNPLPIVECFFIRRAEIPRIPNPSATKYRAAKRKQSIRTNPSKSAR